MRWDECTVSEQAKTSKRSSKGNQLNIHSHPASCRCLRPLSLPANIAYTWFSRQPRHEQINLRTHRSWNMLIFVSFCDYFCLYIPSLSFHLIRTNQHISSQVRKTVVVVLVVLSTLDDMDVWIHVLIIMLFFSSLCCILFLHIFYLLLNSDGLRYVVPYEFEFSFYVKKRWIHNSKL